MGNTISVDKDFDIKDIFPTCIDDNYKATNNNTQDQEDQEDQEHQMHQVDQKDKVDYNALCTKIDDIIVNSNKTFIVSCTEIIKYLKHIKDKPSDKIEASCKYLSYKLKYELKLSKPSCSGKKNAENNDKVLFDICKDHVVDISDSTYYIMGILKELYEYCLFLTDYPDNCDYGVECYKFYRELLLISQNSNNRSFSEVLEKFKDKYNLEMQKWSGCKNVPKILYSYYGRYSHKAFIASFLVVTVISITTFILYKYTKYSIYLQPFIMRLQSLWCKQNEANKLCNLFEKENTKLTHMYNILYNAVE
ncbi:variable surface protein [Plasmodium gonderi]|uniref:Variable surface protein n=1 Tax=Plasmodium gonderi TaxID=77519 RepID=A0A1Y1JR46_PLAGO|nr:variable surface protein [Plasmodium gonderi]GAW83958.1 variable surface protein [Plasmodium gonderi]